jgi:hypothetical protein
VLGLTQSLSEGTGGHVHVPSGKIYFYERATINHYKLT